MAKESNVATVERTKAAPRPERYVRVGDEVTFMNFPPRPKSEAEIMPDANDGFVDPDAAVETRLREWKDRLPARVTRVFDGRVCNLRVINGEHEFDVPHVRYAPEDQNKPRSWH